MNPIASKTGNELDLDTVIDLYRNCSLGARRPIDDRAIGRALLRGANWVVTAWDHEVLADQ